MNAQKSRKFVVAGGMAAVVAIGVVVFALRSQSVAPVAQALPPPAALAPVPTAEAAPIAPIPETAPAVARVPDAPAAVAHKDSALSKSAATKSVAIATPPAIEPKLVRSRPLPKADTSAVASTDTVKRAEPVFDTSEKLAAEAVAAASVPAAPVPAATAPTEIAANDVASVSSADPLTATPATSSPTVADQPVAASTVVPAAAPAAATDSQITSKVKSEISVDSLTRNANIGVTTTDGVVALTGSLSSQDAIDHAKDVAGKVKDVKSVDTTALILASL